MTFVVCHIVIARQGLDIELLGFVFSNWQGLTAVWIKIQYYDLRLTSQHFLWKLFKLFFLFDDWIEFNNPNSILHVTIWPGHWCGVVKSLICGLIIGSNQAAGPVYLIITRHRKPFVLFITQSRGHQHLQLPGIFFPVILFVLHIVEELSLSDPLWSSVRMNIQMAESSISSFLDILSINYSASQ